MSKRSRTALGRRAGRIQLFPAVTLALLAGLGIAFIAYGFLRRITPVDANKTAAEIDVTRVALTVVAGVGGVVALVIAYRRQRDLEQSRFVERFGAAAAQLGATDVAVRIAGVYAMAGVADESDGLRRQQCIDVLCGYLRLPYSPELGANHQSKLVLKHHRATADGTRADDQERHLEYRHNDREVRATIVRVIADHLRPTTEFSWCANDFDFRTAHLEDVDLSNVRFSGAASFEGATFYGSAQFSKAHFSGTAQFGGATFDRIAEFSKAHFNGPAGFSHVTFKGSAQFSEAHFSGTAQFGGATFNRIAEFSKANLYGFALFNATTFKGSSQFSHVTFKGSAYFSTATFNRIADFEAATFNGPAGFSHVTFEEAAKFRDVTFTAGVDFVAATFNHTALFDTVTFPRTASFLAATFSGATKFENATFSDGVSFDEAAFSDIARFDGASFYGTVSFTQVDFGTAPISFVQPRQWGPPAPEFDWDEDVSQKPVNVEPQEWPPAVQAS